MILILATGVGGVRLSARFFVRVASGIVARILVYQKGGVNMKKTLEIIGAIMAEGGLAVIMFGLLAYMYIR